MSPTSTIRKGVVKPPIMFRRAFAHPFVIIAILVVVVVVLLALLFS